MTVKAEDTAAETIVETEVVVEPAKAVEAPKAESAAEEAPG